jgi:hypothetical protein
MNKIEEFKSLQNVYFKRVFLKEDVDNTSLDPKVIEKLKANKDEILAAIKKLTDSEEFTNAIDELIDGVEMSPEDFKNEDKIEELLNSKEEEKEEGEEEVKESYIEEKLGSRLASNISGWKRFAMGEKTPTDESNVQSHRVNKRFEIFQKKVGSHLKELQRDLKTTSDADDSVKKQIDAMVSKLETEHSIKPTDSKLGDIRHSIGRGAEFIGKAVPLLALGAAAGGALASAAGLAGIPATMLKAATAGAIRKAATDVLSGKKPDPKKVATQAAILAVAAPILGVTVDYISNHFSEIEGEIGLTANELEPEPVYVGIDGLDPESSYFERYHGTPFDPQSQLDIAKNKFDSALFDKGIIGQADWADGPSPAFVNAAKEMNLSSDQYQKAAEKLSSLTDEQMKSVMNFINGNIRSAANVGEAQKWAGALIKELVK